MTITQHISIDLQQPGNAPMIHAVQGDEYTRVVEIDLYSGGVAWNPPSNCECVIRYGKPDGKGGIYGNLPDDTSAWTIDGNTISVILAPQMLTVPGIVKAQVALIVDQKQLVSTFHFAVSVEEDSSKGAVKSENYVNWKTYYIPQTAGAIAGQYLKISKVDADGRVIEVVPVDAPSGGGYGGGDLDMGGNVIMAAGEVEFVGDPVDSDTNFTLSGSGFGIDSDGVNRPVAVLGGANNGDPVVITNIAPGSTDMDVANIGQLKTRLPAPLTAAVGQYIRITAVDENGAVTAVEAVDAPSGGGGADEVFVKLEDGTVVPAEVEFDLGDKNTPALVIVPGTAKVGQTIVVKAVDENGKPTEWEAVDLPSGDAGSNIQGNGWSKLGDVIISDAYEYEMLSAENGVITIDASSNHYDYLNSESGVRCLVIPKDITVKEEPKIIHLKVNDFTAGVFEIWNADNSQQITDSIDVVKYKLSANNIANIVLENIPDRDNYKLRVTTPVINVNGLRDYFQCGTMTGLSLEACSIINSTGGCIIEIEATICPYDERYYYKRTKVLWGKQYGGSGQETFDSIHIKPAGVGANKPKDGKVAIVSYWMMFTNGTRFELWGANDA